MKSALATMVAGLAVLWTPPDPGTAIIRGRVVAADGGAPLARAEVRLSGDRNILQFTDADGHYEFGKLPPGRYTVRAGHAGYVPVDRGQPIDLANKQARDGVDFALSRGGAIDVTIVDESGEPIPEVSILAAHGVPRLWPEDARPPRTDRNGQARLFDLAPGTYYLTAKADGARKATFYPGTTVNVEAKPLQVVAMETISVQMRMVMSTGTRKAEGPDGKGRISGRVLTADGSTPLAGATLSLTAANYAVPRRHLRTDANGRYEFGNLPDGYYALHAERRGYVMVDFGKHARNGVARLLRIAGGRAQEQVDVVLQKGASLTVHVVDELGHPHAGVQVMLLQFLGPKRVYASGSMDVFGVVDTDDRGDLRFRDVPPGDYFLCAAFLADDVQLMPASDAPRDRSFTYARSYYPNTTLIRDAEPVALDASQERTIQLTLTPARGAHIAGRVIAADGSPARGDVLLLDPTIVNIEPIPRAHLGADGRFLFPAVWPGHYVFETARNPNEYGSVALDVFNDDVEDLAIETTPPGTLRGRVMFEGGQPPAGVSPEDFSVSAYFHADTIEHRADTRIADDWTFTLTGVVGPSLLTAFGDKDSGWIVSRITQDGGADVTRTLLQNASNLQITMSRASTIEGTVADRNGHRAIYCGVLVFSEGARGSTPFVYVGRSDAQGAFSISAVSPGRYFVVALPDAITDDTTAPASLDRLEGNATRLTIPPAGGVAATLNLLLTEPD